MSEGVPSLPERRVVIALDVLRDGVRVSATVDGRHNASYATQPPGHVAATVFALVAKLLGESWVLPPREDAQCHCQGFREYIFPLMREMARRLEVIERRGDPVSPRAPGLIARNGGTAP